MNQFLPNSIKRFKEYKRLAEKAFDQLKEEDFHFTPNEASNSIAVIIQHMHGNMVSRWTNFLTEDGEKPGRDREGEFEEKKLPREALLKLWDEGWKVVLDTLESLEVSDLDKTITIRTQPLVVIDAILRQQCHYSYHAGQIVYLARMIRNEGWQSLSIPKGGSLAYNQEIKKAGQ